MRRARGCAGADPEPSAAPTIGLCFRQMEQLAMNQADLDSIGRVNRAQLKCNLAHVHTRIGPALLLSSAMLAGAVGLAVVLMALRGFQG